MNKQKEGVTQYQYFSDRIIESFDSFYENQWTAIRSIEDLIHLIRIYYKLNEAEILDIWKNTKYSNADCLTMCIVWKLICKEYWFDVDIGHPVNFSRYYHHFLVTKDWKKLKLSWRSKIRKYKLLSDSEIEWRLRLIHPVISLANRIKEKTKTYTSSSREESPVRR